jgi:hypothetical protein
MDEWDVVLLKKGNANGVRIGDGVYFYPVYGVKAGELGNFRAIYIECRSRASADCENFQRVHDAAFSSLAGLFTRGCSAAAP